MCFIWARLHITCEIHRNDYSLIHFDEQRRRENRTWTWHVDTVAQERRGNNGEAIRDQRTGGGVDVKEKTTNKRRRV